MISFLGPFHIHWIPGVSQVSIARVYNANVVQKRSLTGSTAEEP